MELQRLSSLSEQAEPLLKETKGKGIVASMLDIKVNYGLFEIVLILGNKIDRACSVGCLWEATLRFCRVPLSTQNGKFD